MGLKTEVRGASYSYLLSRSSKKKRPLTSYLLRESSSRGPLTSYLLQDMALACPITSYLLQDMALARPLTSYLLHRFHKFRPFGEPWVEVGVSLCGRFLYILYKPERAAEEEKNLFLHGRHNNNKRER